MATSDQIMAIWLVVIMVLACLWLVYRSSEDFSEQWDDPWHDDEDHDDWYSADWTCGDPTCRQCYDGEDPDAPVQHELPIPQPPPARITAIVDGPESK